MSHEKVTPLKPVDQKNPEPNEHCIHMLREALKRAKTGEVQGVALTLAVVDHDSMTMDGSIHMVSYAARYKNALFMGVEVLRFSMMHEVWDGVKTTGRTELEDGDE